MVTVTQSAREELKRIRETNGFEPQQCLRLAMVAPQTLGLVLDEASEQDQVEDVEGTRVLLIGPDVGEALEGATIDLQDEGEGHRFQIIPPAGQCGEEGCQECHH
ncbi:MAG: hypothetical protein HYY01_11265 [Chloroflexi bacterium]|nr:hypothetical protein [Chloroflexota bacterium]